MKRLIPFIFTLIPIIMLAQKQSTFLYELTLYPPYANRAMWTEREQVIQKQHVSYLNSLEKNGALLMAGIMDQNLEAHTGFVFLQTDDYQEAYEIVQKDPSIKEGMMSAHLRPVNIYFKPGEK